MRSRCHPAVTLLELVLSRTVSMSIIIAGEVANGARTSVSLDDTLWLYLCAVKESENAAKDWVRDKIKWEPNTTSATVRQAVYALIAQPALTRYVNNTVKTTEPMVT